MKNKTGFSQIYLLLGLLLMAIAVPVATKLVQQSQDNRNLARVTEGECTQDSDCGAGKVCNNLGKCVAKTVCTETKCTSAKLKLMCTDETCSGNCGFYHGTKNCSDKPTSRPTSIPPTLTPTKPPACTPIGGSFDFGKSTCCSNAVPQTSGGRIYCVAKPTAVPTTSTCKANGQTALTSARCCSGYGEKLPNDQYLCKVKPLPTLTACELICRNAGGSPACIECSRPTTTPVPWPTGKVCCCSSNGNCSRVATASCLPRDGMYVGPNANCINPTSTPRPTLTSCEQYCKNDPGGTMCQNCAKLSLTPPKSTATKTPTVAATRTPTTRAPNSTATKTPTTRAPNPTSPNATATSVPTATATAIPGTPILNYKFAYVGVNPSAAQCVIDWPNKVIVLSAGVSRSYVNVIPPTKTEVNGKLQFSGSLALTGFSKFSNIAVFFKGPKHLQTKYGINNQTTVYNKAGGEIALTSVASTSPIYDFTGFPMMPGDVVGTDSETQDGWINGVDFAYVKAKSLVHETVAVGGYLKGDLDGNCQVNSNDINLLKISLQEKQGQLY